MTLLANLPLPAPPAAPPFGMAGNGTTCGALAAAPADRLAWRATAARYRFSRRISSVSAAEIEVDDEDADAGEGVFKTSSLVSA